MIKISQDSLLQFFQEEGLKPVFQKETGQIYIVLKIAGHDFPLFVRIFEQSSALQLLTFLPFSITSDTINDLSRCLHLLNKQIDIPGFGIDESSKTCFYRIIQPYRNQMIDKDILKSYIKAIQTLNQSLSSLIISVANGTLTFQQVLQASQNAR